MRLIIVCCMYIVLKYPQYLVKCIKKTQTSINYIILPIVVVCTCGIRSLPFTFFSFIFNSNDTFLVLSQQILLSRNNTSSIKMSSNCDEKTILDIKSVPTIIFRQNQWVLLKSFLMYGFTDLGTLLCSHSSAQLRQITVATRPHKKLNMVAPLSFLSRVIAISIRLVSWGPSMNHISMIWATFEPTFLTRLGENTTTPKNTTMQTNYSIVKLHTFPN